MLAAEAAAGSIEREPITIHSLRTASRFTLQRFMNGCARMFRPYISLGLLLMLVYGVSIATYIGFVAYGYRGAADRVLVIGWTFIAALSAGGLIAWFTVVNLPFLLGPGPIPARNCPGFLASRSGARVLRAVLR